MKKLLLSSLAMAALSMGSSANAVDFTSAAFNVQVTLASACKALAFTATAVDFGSYAALTNAAKVDIPGPTFGIECTRNLTGTPTTAFDVGTNRTAAGDGVIAGLNYKLKATASAVLPGTAATAASTTTGNGTSTKYNYVITGDMPANQPGSVVSTANGETGSAASHTRTLTITF